MNRTPLVISIVSLFFALTGAAVAGQHYLGTATTAGIASKFTRAYGKTVQGCDPNRGRCHPPGSLARCPAGTVVIGGGWDYGTKTLPPLDATVGYNGPAYGGGWAVEELNRNDQASGSFEAVAICAR